MIERVICASCAGDKSYFCFSDLGRNEFWEDPYAKLQRFTVFDATHANRWALSEPFRKVVESDESVVIQGAVGGHRACGQKITVEPQIVEGFGIRAI